MTTTSTRTVTVHAADIGPIEVAVSDRGERHPFPVLHGGADLQSVTGFARDSVRQPGAQAMPEALSGLYPGARNRSWSWRRRMPVLLPSMTG